ncbi:hypothetical protein PproGo58_25810 [Pseudomonas protegens]|nr:hypothetical protein PproGo58_25810 [Pseudomonas protegens]
MIATSFTPPAIRALDRHQCPLLSRRDWRSPVMAPSAAYQVDGQMVDAPVLQQARRLLALA